MYVDRIQSSVYLDLTQERIIIYIYRHTHTIGVSGGIVNILGGGSMDYSG